MSMPGASQPYTDTTIIDCNRNCSLENETGNDTTPALFTNKQGPGFKLEVGDKVSVHSAYINEIGNTDGTLEFKGVALTDTDNKQITYKLKKTKKTFKSQMPLDNTWSDNTHYPWVYDAAPPDNQVINKWGKPTGFSQEQLLQPYGYKHCGTTNEEETFTMKDNEMNFQISYYKTADGENCFHLPRRYDTAQGQALKNYKGLAQWFPLQPLSHRIDTEDQSLVWAYKGLQGNQGKGCPAETLGLDDKYVKFDCGGNGAVLNTPRQQSMCDEDWHFNDLGQQKATQVLTAIAAADRTACETLNGLGTDARYMQKHDNSRYKIFIKEDTYFTSAPTFTEFLTPTQLGNNIEPAGLAYDKGNDFLDYQADTDPLLPNNDPVPIARGSHLAMPATSNGRGASYWNVRDPACTANWIPYQEIKNIKVPVGYSSPEDIAETISQQLNTTEPVETIFSRVGKRTATPPNTQPGDDADVAMGVNHVQVGIKKNGECYKQFYATNHGHFNINNAKEYFVTSADGTLANAPEKKAAATRYMSAYHYIGVKRPSIWEAGRNIYKDRVKSQNDPGGDTGGKTWGEITEYALNGNYHTAGSFTQGREGTPITNDNKFDSLIVTNIPWSKRHLMSKFINAQGEYPELFNYKHTFITKPTADPDNRSEFSHLVDKNNFQMGNSETGETYARYLHFDPIKNDSKIWFPWGEDGDALKTYAERELHHDQRRLGCDNYRFCDATDPLITHGAEALPAGQEPETQNGYKTIPTVVDPPAPADPVTSNTNGQTYTADPSGYKPMYDLSSLPMWFYYNQANAEIDNDMAGGGMRGGHTLDDDKGQLKTPDKSTYAYGCMIRYTAEPGAPDVSFIAFDPRPIGGVPSHFFNAEGNPFTDSMNLQSLDGRNYIGYDRHFNAYGTSAIMLYSGYLNSPQDCKASTTALPSTGGTNGTISNNNAPEFSYLAPVGNTAPEYNIKPQGLESSTLVPPARNKNNMENVYRNFLGTQLGASQISLSYDEDKQKRFSFKHLHTPERIGNNFNAGSDATDPIVDDASSEVYKINKRLNGGSFCPDMVPYDTDITTKNKDDTETAITISGFNHNIIPWTAIYDTSSGVYFDGFGGTDVNKKFWEKCLWGLLGFTYNQLNFNYVNNKNTNFKLRLNGNSRINPENQGKTPQLFTNSYVKSADLQLYDTNSYGAHMYSGSSPFAPIYQSKNTSPDTIFTAGVVNNPPISIQCDSVSIKADSQPTKMLRPYYLIKSNIVGDMKYIGAGHTNEGGQKLPIVGVVNKENGFGDYYFQTSVKNVFTITKPYTITDITTSIHDPDMSLARVDKNSAVLYMVEKQNNNNLNLVNSLVQTKQFNPQVLNPTSLTDQQYNQYFRSFILNKEQVAQEEQGFINDHWQVPDTLAHTGLEQDQEQLPPSQAGGLGLNRAMSPRSWGMNRAELEAQLPPIGEASGAFAHNIPRARTRAQTEHLRGVRASADEFIPEAHSRLAERERIAQLNQEFDDSEGGAVQPPTQETFDLDAFSQTGSQSSIGNPSTIATTPSEPDEPEPSPD